MAIALPAFPQLTPDCTVTILNRTTQVDANGNWFINNVPTNLGLVSAHAVCTKNGQTTFGKTTPQVVVPGLTTGYDANITLGPTDFTPSSIAISAPSLVLNQVGATVQLTVAASYPAGNTADVTTLASGTSYLSSNPGIATVSQNGLVTARAPGTVIISAAQDGATAFLSLQVSSPIDTDGDGIPDDAEVRMRLNPNNPIDGSQDFDGDGLSNLEEYRLGTDIRLADSDGDGIPDGLEVKLGLNPLQIDPTTRVTGNVVDAANHGVAGVTVTVFGLIASPPTDGTGAFTILFVPASLGSISGSAILLSSPVQSGISVAVAPVAGGTTNLGNIQIVGNSGTVAGIVTDTSSNLIQGAQLSVTSGPIALTATSGPGGQYLVPNVLAGSVTVVAFDPATGLRGRGTGTLAAGGNLTVNLRIVSSGAVSGVVYRNGGTTPAARIPVTLASTGVPASTVTDVFGKYSFDVVPAGAVTVDVSDSATGDRGRTTTTLAANAIAASADVTLNGVGRAVVTVTVGGVRVSGAAVTLTSQTQFGGSQSSTTLSDGTATFNQVLAGGVSVTATNPTNNQTSSANITVLAGTTANITVPFQAGPGTGSITGKVLAPDGLTGVSGETVKLIDAGYQVHLLTSAYDGSFHFDGYALGMYSLIALDGSGRTQAHEVGIVIANGGDVITRNLVLVATATVSGVVLNPDSSRASGIAVSLRSYNPVVGGVFSATAGLDGSYSIAAVPVGDFTVSAADLPHQAYGEKSSQVITGGLGVTADVQLTANTVALPITKFDANNFSFDLQADGSIATGYNYVFGGAFLLDIISGGTPIRFTGSSTGSTSLGGRQVAVTQSVAQLNVTRKVYVPRDGYFARYVEVLNNPTASPVSVGVRVTSRVFESESVIQTSNTNGALSIASPTNPDRWVVLDDYLDQEPDIASSRPASAFGFDGPGARARAGAASFSNGQLSYEWDNVVVPAGATLAFMHFGVQQPLRSSAQISIDRLGALPPEALVGFDAAEIGQIQNFAIDPQGTSALPALPPMTGNINGRVLDWDGITPISGLASGFLQGATVNFTSGSAFFGRTRSLIAGLDGSFNLSSVFSETGTSMVLPVGPFILSAVHPTTKAQSPSIAGIIPSGQSPLQQNLLFTNTGSIRGVAQFNSGSLPVLNRILVRGQWVALISGSFLATGLLPGSALVDVTLWHPQDSWLEGSGNAVVVAGQTTDVGNLLPPTGTISGKVQIPNSYSMSDVIVGVDTSIITQYQSLPIHRGTRPDPMGNYKLWDVPVGTWPMNAQGFSDPPFARISSVPVVANQNTVENLVPLGVGTVNVTVLSSTGLAISGATVKILDIVTFHGFGPDTLVSDATGRVSFTNVPVGVPFRVTAIHSALNLGAGPTLGTVDKDGATVNITLALPATGTVSVTVSYPRGTSAAANTPVWLSSENLFALPQAIAAVTDASGAHTFNQVPINVPFSVTARASDNSHYGAMNNQTLTTAGGSMTVNVVFGAVVTINVTVTQGSTAVGGSLVVLSSPPQIQSVTTGTNGVGTFTNIGEGTYTVSAYAPQTGLLLGQVTRTVGPADDEATLAISIDTAQRGTVQGTVFAADGVTPIPNALFDIRDGATGMSIAPCGEMSCGGITDSNGFFRMTVLVPGSLGFKVVAGVVAGAGEVTTEQTGSFSTGGQIVTVNLTLRVSVVKGTVFQSNGTTPVAFPSVFAFQGASSYYGISDNNGNYAIFGIPLGGFAITAQDPNSTLVGTANGAIAAVENSVALNVTMQPAGAVTGQVLSSSASGVPFALAGGSTNGIDFNLSTTADSSGFYRFDQVPLGNVLLQGLDPSTGISNRAQGALTANGQTVNVNIALPPTASVQGTVISQDGQTTVSAASVAAESLSSSGPLGTFRTFGTAAGGGVYQMAGIPVGSVRVTAADPNNVTSLGFVDGTLALPGPLVLNPQLGSAVHLGLVNLDGADGFRYDIDCWGGLHDGGTPDRRLTHAYSPAEDAMLVGYSSVVFPCSNSAGVDLSGRQITIGPAAISGVSLTRKIFAPPAGKFARYLENLFNPTTVPIVVDLQISGYIGAFTDGQLVVDPATTSNTYAVTEYVGTCCSPTLAFVLGGLNAPTAATVEAFYASYYSYHWHVTVPAGQTVTLMHFAVQREMGDSTGAMALAQALVNLTDPDALTGLSAADKAQILNFIVP